jgi:hypothetical protein
MGATPTGATVARGSSPPEGRPRLGGDTLTGWLFSAPAVLLMAVFIVLPFIYAIAALIFVPIGCWIYNVVASRLGGIQITVTETQG